MSFTSRLAVYASGRPLKEWFRNFFQYGIWAVAVEEEADLKIGILDAQGRVLDKAAGIAQRTKPLRESDDELERYIAAITAETLRETLELGRAMLNPMTVDEKAEALSRPLDASTASQPSLPPAAAQAALTAPSGPNGTTEAAGAASLNGNGSQPDGPQAGPLPQVKRGRGRPRKHPLPGETQG